MVRKKARDACATGFFRVFWRVAGVANFCGMNLQHQVREWFRLDGCYLDGVALYRRCGGAYPVRTFEGYERAAYVPDRIEALLKTALGDWLGKQPVGIGEKQGTRDEPVRKQPLAPTPNVADDEPDEILLLRSRARKLHKRQALIHAQLGQVETDGERYELALELMEDVVPALDALYDQIRAWKETGELPVSAKPDGDLVQATVKKMQRLGSLASRISRLKALLKGHTLQPIERQDYEKELLEKKVEEKELRKELGIENQ